MLRTERETMPAHRDVLRIKTVRSQLIAAAARGPITQAIDEALGSGVTSRLSPRADRGDHAAMAILDATRALVVVEGGACALLIHEDGSFNWVDGGAVRFPVATLRRVLLVVAPRMEWKRRSALCSEVRTADHDRIPSIVRAYLGPDAVVLIGAEATLPPEEAHDEDGILDLLAEVAEIDHRATPAVVRRVVSPDDIQPDDAWRLADGVFEASTFDVPPGSGSLDIVAAITDADGELPPLEATVGSEPPPRVESPRPSTFLEEAPTLWDPVEPLVAEVSPPPEGELADVDATLDRTERPQVHREAPHRWQHAALAVALFGALGLLLAALALLLGAGITSS